MQLQHLAAILRRNGDGAELLKGSSLTFIVRVSGMVVTYGFNFLVARFFGASALGAFTLATTIVTILAMLSRLGFDRAIVRLIAASISSGRKGAAAFQFRAGLVLLIALGSVLSIALYLAADFVAVNGFAKPEQALVFRYAAPAVLLFSIGLYCAEALRGLKKIWAFSTIRYVSIYAIAIPLLFLLRNSLEPSVLPTAVFTVACGIAAVIAVLLAWRAFPGFSRNAAVSLASMLAVSLPMLLSNSMGMVISWTDVLMLGRFVADDQIGVYSIALKLAFLTSIVLNAVNGVSTPKFAELHASGDLQRLARVIHQTTKLLFYTTVPILVVLILGGSYLLGLFGPEFTAGYVTLVILTLGQFVSAVSGPVANVLQMTGHERAFLGIVGLCAAINVVANSVLIPTFGILGAGIASAFSLTLNNVLCVVMIYRRLGFLSVYIPFLTRRSIATSH